MTINEVAEILTNCANGECKGCPEYKWEEEFCEKQLIERMGAEVRKIADEMKEQKHE